MISENISTLKIHKLSQAQYDRELAAGNLDESALYLTPDEVIDLSPYETKADATEKLNTAKSYADTVAKNAVDALYANLSWNGDIDLTVANADQATRADMADEDINGNPIVDTYETKTDATSKLNTAKSYTDTEIDKVRDELVQHYINDQVFDRTVYELESDASAKLTEAKSYTDTAVAAINSVPSCTTTNNGQFLRVVNGVPTWVTVDDGDGVSY